MKELEEIKNKLASIKAATNTQFPSFTQSEVEILLSKVKELLEVVAVKEKQLKNVGELTFEADARIKELQEGIEKFIDWTTTPEASKYIKNIPDHIWKPLNKLLEEK